MGAEKQQHSAGWYAGALVFWLLSAWLATVGLSSITPQIFWPAGDARTNAPSCGPTLQDLRSQLLLRMSQSIATPAPSSRPDAELLVWFEQWDRLLFEAKPACLDHELAAWRELTRFRYGMQGLIERFERDEAPHNERFDSLLGSPSAITAPAPREAHAHSLEDHTP